jgi:hypothetical protein
MAAPVGELRSADVGIVGRDEPAGSVARPGAGLLPLAAPDGRHHDRLEPNDVGTAPVRHGWQRRSCPARGIDVTHIRVTAFTICSAAALPPSYQNIITGAVLLIAAGIGALSRRLSATRRS